MTNDAVEIEYIHRPIIVIIIITTQMHHDHWSARGGAITHLAAVLRATVVLAGSWLAEGCWLAVWLLKIFSTIESGEGRGTETEKQRGGAAHGSALYIFVITNSKSPPTPPTPLCLLPTTIIERKTPTGCCLLPADQSHVSLGLSSLSALGQSSDWPAGSNASLDPRFPICNQHVSSR